MKLRIACVIVGFLSLVVSMAAQTSGSSPAQVPPLIQVSNVATDEGGTALSGGVNITFSLYNTQQAGEPLWTETQTGVLLDPTGHYSVQLGVTKANGVPASLFASGEARWLGVRIAEQPEQPRVLLLSVPYALKAADAATVGGLPPSAFVLAAPQNRTASVFAMEPATGESAPPPSGAVTGTGTVNFLPLWDTTSDITSSALFQSGTGTTAKIGVNTTTPASTLDVKGGTTVRGALSLPTTGVATVAGGKNSQPMNLAASAFNSTSSTAANQTFQWLAEPAGNDTSTPSGTLNLLFGEGTAKPSETGLQIASNGQVAFAAGQTFPGTGDGTITGVTAGTDLTGGGTSGNVTVNLNTGATDSRYARLTTANTFTANQAVNGSVSAASADIGVHGISDGASTTGTGHGNAGVWGDSGAVAGSGHTGVLGTADANSAGWFLNNGKFATVVATNSGPGDGVRASANSSTGIGILGSSPNVGVYGASSVSSSQLGVGFANIGVWGETMGTSGGDYLAVLGTSDDNPAGAFYNSSLCCGTLIVENDEGSHTGMDFAAYGNTGSIGPQCAIDDNGNLFCTGTTSHIVAVDGGARKIAVYSMQSPENWYEDAGSGQLSKGYARIELDPTFTQTVNAGVEYHVFVTPNGDCKGLYASQKSATSFEVHELGGGKSNITFDYRIMAKRAGYENLRLGNVTEKFGRQAAHAPKIRRSVGASAAARSGPVVTAATNKWW
jgi:hypothetical protein